MESKLCRVLFVEDNDDHAELAIRHLADFCKDNELVRLADGEAALDYLYRRGRLQDPKENPLPHVILLDLRLPKVDGLHVLQDIKRSEALSHIPVVVLTTSESERDLASAYEFKANAYVVKPVDFAKFVQLMRDLGLFWLGWNRRPSSRPPQPGPDESPD